MLRSLQKFVLALVMVLVGESFGEYFSFDKMKVDYSETYLYDFLTLSIFTYLLSIAYFCR